MKFLFLSLTFISGNPLFNALRGTLANNTTLSFAERYYPKDLSFLLKPLLEMKGKGTDRLDHIPFIQLYATKAENPSCVIESGMLLLFLVEHRY